MQGKEHCQNKVATLLEWLGSERMEKQGRRKKGGLLIPQHLKQSRC